MLNLREFTYLSNKYSNNKLLLHKIPHFKTKYVDKLKKVDYQNYIQIFLKKSDQLDSKNFP